jgi:hypothetical protein
MTPTKVIGLCMWARGENYSGQSHWVDGCPVVLMGIDDSDLHPTDCHEPTSAYEDIGTEDLELPPRSPHHTFY